VTFHSLFYQILTPFSHNFIDFGSLISNTPTVRTFKIENISTKKLLINLSSNLPEEIKIYSIRQPQDNIVSPLQP